MKTPLKYIIILIIVINSSTSYSQFNDSRRDPNVEKKYSEWSEYECNCFINSDFFAFINAYAAVAQAQVNAWLNTRENAFKREIENRLNENFDNFDDAQFEYFKNTYEINELASYEYNKYKEFNDDASKVKELEMNRIYSKYKLFDYRTEDAISISIGAGSIYDFGGLEYQGDPINEFTISHSSHISSANYDYYNEWRSGYQHTLKVSNALQNVIANQKLQEYFSNLLISDYNDYSNYKTRIELMLNYLVWDFQQGSLLQLPPNFPNKYPLRLYDYSSVLSNMINNADTPNVNYHPDYSFNKVKTLYVINYMFNNYSLEFVEGNEVLFDKTENYLDANNFKKNNIEFIDDLFRRYNSNGLMTSDDRIEGLYESNYKSFQIEDRPRNILTLKLSQYGKDGGLLGVSQILEYISLNGDRIDFEGHLIGLILSRNGITNIYQNFTYEELGTLFNFYYVQNDYIKIIFDPFISNYLNYDGQYGTSLFTNPMKIRFLKWIANYKMDEVNILIDYLYDNNFSNDSFDFINTVMDEWPNQEDNWEYGFEEFLKYFCTCNCTGTEIGYSNNLDLIEEPKWGQLSNKQEIIDEINSVDMTGLSYNEQVVALAEHFNKNIMYDRNNNGELYIVNPQDDVNKYIYTEIGGWIDFHHVFKLFEWATENGPFTALSNGELGEMWQSLKNNASAYSYEDLPSNLFGVGLYRRFSQDIFQGNISWGDAVSQALDEIDWVEPEQAPNFDYIPHIIGNGLYPQNFTYTPLLGDELMQYHMMKFCERTNEEQLNIIEAHENFER